MSVRERYASGMWLTPALVAFVSGVMIVGTIGALGYLVMTSQGYVDSFGRPVGTDFTSFWTAGRMVLEGHAAQAYDWAAIREVQRHYFVTEAFYPWNYPPLFLMVVAALATMPYGVALIVWQAASLAAVLSVLWRILPGPRAMLVGVAFPAVLLCLGHGQTGFLTAALLAGGILMLPRHEVFAGVLFGLLAYKPQFGLLVPLALMAGGYRRAIAAAAATVIAGIGLTLAIWGWPVWQAFFDWMPHIRTVVFEAGVPGFEKFQSIFAWVRLIGGPVGAAYAMQGLVTLSVVIACVWIWRSNVSLAIKGAALLAGTLLSSPYVLDYDFISLGMAIALLAAHGLERGFMRWEKTMLALAWIAPLMARSIAQTVYIPVGFLALAGIFALIVARAVAERRVEAPTAGVAGQTLTTNLGASA